MSSPSQQDIQQTLPALPRRSLDAADRVDEKYPDDRKSIEKSDPASVEGVEVSDGSDANRPIVPTRPPIVWNEGVGGFFKSFGARVKSIFDRRFVFSLLVSTSG